MPKSVFEGDVEKITSEYNVAEDWQGIMDLCDKIKSLPNSSKEALKCIMKRVNHPVPHVAMQALTLLAACGDNCGKSFHLEICSREWTNEARTTINRSHGKVSEKLRGLVQKWAESFKNDPQLNLMVQFYKKLKADGFSFESPSGADAPGTIAGTSSQVPSQVKDEVAFKEDLDLAIAMSLQESGPGPTASSGSSALNHSVGSSGLYPSVSGVATQAATAVSGGSGSADEQVVCEVRALYNFEAAEDNEMTFKVGEVFSVLDNSDENWWKGRNARGVGLFPANFVTTDLVEKNLSSGKKVHFDLSDAEQGPVSQPPATVSPTTVVINEEQLDLTLSMLKNASPNEIDIEEETIMQMEESAAKMGTAMEKKVLSCEQKKEHLEEVNEKFLQALALYQQLMKEPVVAAPPPPPPQPVQPTYPMMGSHLQTMPIQQQMLAHSMQNRVAAMPTGYTSLPPQLDTDAVAAAYHGQGPSSMAALLAQQQKQMMIQQGAATGSPSFSAAPTSAQNPSLPSLQQQLPQQQLPQQLPPQQLVQQPSSLPMQGYVSAMSYNPQLIQPIPGDVAAQAGSLGQHNEVSMNYGYVPKASVYQ